MIMPQRMLTADVGTMRSMGALMATSPAAVKRASQRASPFLSRALAGDGGPVPQLVRIDPLVAEDHSCIPKAPCAGRHGKSTHGSEQDAASRPLSSPLQS